MSFLVVRAQAKGWPTTVLTCHKVVLPLQINHLLAHLKCV